MDKTKLSSKGQVIIPKAVRDKKGWQAGDELIVEDRPDGVLLKRKSRFRPTTLDEVIGIAGYTGPPKSIEDMERGIDEALRERWERKSRKTGKVRA